MTSSLQSKYAYHVTKKIQPRFLQKTCCWTAHQQAQSVEHQRTHRRASVNESHVFSGPLGSAAAGTRRERYPPRQIYCAQIKSQAIWSCFAAAGHDVSTTPRYPHTAIDSRLRVAINSVFLCCTSLRPGFGRRCPYLCGSAPHLYSYLTGQVSCWCCACS